MAIFLWHMTVSRLAASRPSHKVDQESATCKLSKGIMFYWRQRSKSIKNCKNLLSIYRCMQLNNTYSVGVVFSYECGLAIVDNSNFVLSGRERCGVMQACLY